ncbi:MAG: hypothetical protein J6Y20_06300, partial [Lachnospiraceae bacterium]|nr:hypothetical protein [Lachnospiraceae bacterium]
VQPVKGGATGVTRLIAGTPNVTISPETGTGEVTINVTGGTGGGGGSLSYVCIGEEPDTETGIINAQANTAYFIAVFGDLYYDEEDGYICQYYYTVDYSVTPQVYTRHKTDYNDLESYSAGYGYSMELVLPAPSEDSIIEICLFAYTSVLISSTKPIRNYQGTPPINQPYPITNRNVKFVYIAEDHGGTWYMYGN